MIRLFVFLFCLFLLAVAKADNIQIQSGATMSNAWVGGRIYASFTSMTNCCAGGTLTNLNGFYFAGNVLTNNGDTIAINASGRFSTTGQSKRIVATLGSQDVLDTGLQAVSNDTWRITGFISRTTAGQYYNFLITWDRAVIGGQTNSSGLISQTNGVSTYFKLQGAANVVSSITNECLTADYIPGPR